MPRPPLAACDDERHLVTFRISRFTDALSAREIGGFCTAVATVWEQHVGLPVHFPVIIADRVEVGAFGPTDAHATAYVAGERAFIVAVDQLQAWAAATPGADLMLTAVLVGAHEAMHAVQDFHGALPRSPTEWARYAASHAGTHIEQDAWIESLRVCKAVFPDASGDIVHEGVTHRIPHATPYAGRIEGVRFTVEPLNVLPPGLAGRWETARPAPTSRDGPGPRG
jgi:hypothetical protein